jgi:hypothetical protein
MNVRRRALPHCLWGFVLLLFLAAGAGPAFGRSPSADTLIVPRIPGMSTKAVVETIPVDDVFFLSAPPEVQDAFERGEASVASRSFVDRDRQVAVTLMTSQHAGMPRAAMLAIKEVMGESQWTAGTDASVWWGGRAPGLDTDVMVVTRAGSAAIFLMTPPGSFSEADLAAVAARQRELLPDAVGSESSTPERVGRTVGIILVPALLVGGLIAYRRRRRIAG